MSARLSDALDRMFWPTMITDSITSWMNVWLTQLTIASTVPCCSADGRATSASTANA